ITLAQGILESGAGKGELCKKANNHFGIKCHVGWQGDMVFHDDDSEQECFRKYNHPAESYKDHSLFLTSRERYKKLFSLDTGDYKSWAQGLKDAGYATDPKYPAKLIHIIEKFKLHEIDSFVLGYDYNSSANENKSFEAVTNGYDKSKQHSVIKGDTLYSLSKKYNISIADLKKINQLESEILSLGQILKIKQ
ncbi:MAG TPA: hemagglutinin, partial [Flavobacterium sp.]|nr:hemagglutinin [Flavobacterium sp.]